MKAPWAWVLRCFLKGEEELRSQVWLTFLVFLQLWPSVLLLGRVGEIIGLISIPNLKFPSECGIELMYLLSIVALPQSTV